MNTPKDSTGGCCPPPPCSADPFMEEISDKIRRGEPVGIREAFLAIEYQRLRKLQRPPLWKRVIQFFLPNVSDDLSRNAGPAGASKEGVQ